MGKNIVQIIAATNTDWNVLIQSCISAFGRSPTRELDLNQIKLEEPKAYSIVLELLNNRKDAFNLKKAYRSLDFIHLTFFIQFEDSEQFDSFCNLSNLCSLVWTNKSSKVGIFNGSLKQIKSLIELCCCKDISDEIRLTGNKIYILLDRAGYKELFNGKKALEDGTFVLEA